MNSKEFISILRNAYRYFSNVIYFRISTEAEHEKMYHYTKAEYESDLKKLLDFDINNLWDKKFWGLKVSESICAIAVEPNELLSKIKKYYREQK
jgi:hypothetical protein